MTSTEFASFQGGGVGLAPEEEPARPSWKAVYTIVERNGRRHWLRLGVAFVNRDASLTVRLDAMPVSGQLHIRDAPPRDATPRDREFDDRIPEFGHS